MQWKIYLHMGTGKSMSEFPGPVEQHMEYESQKLVELSSTVSHLIKSHVLNFHLFVNPRHHLKAVYTLQSTDSPNVFTMPICGSDLLISVLDLSMS